MATPAANGLNPLVLVAARLCGVDVIYKIGGAQAIAAFAYGTAAIPKTNIITGPGNIYVTLAKKEVFGDCGIDMLAGPSEILVIADNSANPYFVACDLLSQAEHDQRSRAILITTDERMAREVAQNVEKLMQELPKAAIAKEAIADSFIIVADSVEECARYSNAIAPEHLELCVSDPQGALRLISNAGAVFMDNYSPEPLGDYYAGPSHVLPTGRTSKFFSPLSVDTYLRKISLISYSKEKLFEAADDIIELARAEGLDAHANAVLARMESNKTE